MRRSWVVALLVLVGACTGPVRSFEVYESKAGQTAEVAVSAVQTALLAVDDMCPRDTQRASSARPSAASRWMEPAP